MFEIRFSVTPTFLWILPPACNSMAAVSMRQSLTLLGSLPWKVLPTRSQAPTSIGGKVSGRLAGMASAEVGGLASVATAGGGAIGGGAAAGGGGGGGGGGGAALS